MFIYILELEQNKYYIGKTTNIAFRLKDHIESNGAAWTRKYKPISVDKIIPNASPFDEDRYTKEYMSKYGIDKVRGGSYVKVELDDFQKETLNREIWAAKDMCTQCGRKGHWINDCHAKTVKQIANKKEKTCYRCGRPGHYSLECYAKTHHYGYTLDSDESDESDESDKSDESDESY